jgi:tripartite-type tricarboxylate transporter receptor subunit TctC
MIVGLTAGGLVDLTTRLFADSAGEVLQQTMIVENRPGGAGSVAASLVQRAAPDGYTLLVFSGAQHAAVPAMQKVAYDQIKGFQPITTIFAIHNMVLVPKNSPANSLQELLEIGRKKPGGLQFGTPGFGSPAHLTAARMGRTTGTPISAVQYRGGTAMLPDLVSGRLDFGMASLAPAKSFYEDGKLKLLAIDADKRWPDLPNVPTIHEAGVEQPRVADWFGLAAPAGTPMLIVEKIREAFVEAAKRPEMIRRLREIGTVSMLSGPQELGAMMEREAEQTGELIRWLEQKPR